MFVKSLFIINWSWIHHEYLHEYLQWQKSKGLRSGGHWRLYFENEMFADITLTWTCFPVVVWGTHSWNFYKHFRYALCKWATGDGDVNEAEKKSQKLNEANAQRGASYIYSSPKIIRVFKCQGTVRVAL